jgi:putative transposase
MHPRQSSPPDRRDREGNWLPPLGPEAKSGGRPAAYPTRDILNGVLYLRRSGWAWRLLHELPPWRSVSHAWHQWRQDGTWHLRPDVRRGAVRVAAGKRRQPRAGISDSQAVKTPEKGGAGALMPINTSKAASATASLIP